MNYTKNQHVQLPSVEVKDDITPQDQLVYVSIKRFMNKDTYEAFPSMQTLCRLTGASEPTVKKCIDRLADNDYITISKKGRNKLYTFNKDKADNFEIFSYEFLDNDNLDFREKAYLISTQRYMFKHPETQTGVMTLSTREQSSNINMSQSTIVRCQKSLERKGYLDIVKTQARDLETGCQKDAKIFQLNELGQAIVFTLTDHEDRISLLEKQVADLVKMNQILRNENQSLKDVKPKSTVITL